MCPESSDWSMLGIPRSYVQPQSQRSMPIILTGCPAPTYKLKRLLTACQNFCHIDSDWLFRKYLCVYIQITLHSYIDCWSHDMVMQKNTNYQEEAVLCSCFIIIKCFKCTQQKPGRNYNNTKSYEIVMKRYEKTRKLESTSALNKM